MIRGWAALGVAGLALSLALQARVASGQGDDRAGLEVGVNDLEQELAVVKRKLEVDDETQSAKGPQPVLSAGSDGFTLRSADANWVLKLRGYMQFDTRFFTD